jgi:hypothetical protein
MICCVRHWLAATALLAATVTAPHAFGQAPRDIPAPRPRQENAPSAPDAPQTLPVPTATDDGERPAPYVLPPAGWPGLEFSRPDPLLDRPDAPLPGFYFDVETNVVFPHLRNQLFVPVTISPTQTDTIHFSGNRLDATISPRFEVGYRLLDGWGGLQLAYSFEATSGSNSFLSDQGSLAQHGRLDVNIVEFDYVSREFSLGPQWEMRWGVGAQAMSFYFDSAVNFLNPGTTPGTVLSQTEASSAVVYGGHAMLDLSWRTPVPGLAVVGRLKIADSFGRIRQTGTEQLESPSGDGTVALLRSTIATSVNVQSGSGMFGLSYTVPEWNHSRFLLGYEYEVFFDIGRQNDSRGQLDNQALFLRAELNF